MRASVRSGVDSDAVTRPSPAKRVVLVGFSGGGAFAGGLALDDPTRYTAAAILFGTLPFDAGVPTTLNRLAGLPVLVAHGDADTVIPRELLERTWRYLHKERAPRSTACATRVATASVNRYSMSSPDGS